MASPIYLPQAVGGLGATLAKLGGFLGQAGGTYLQDYNRSQVLQEAQSLPPEQQAQFIASHLGPDEKDFVDTILRTHAAATASKVADSDIARNNATISHMGAQTDIVKLQGQNYQAITDADLAVKRAQIGVDNARIAGSEADLARKRLELEEATRAAASARQMQPLIDQMIQQRLQGMGGQGGGLARPLDQRGETPPPGFSATPPVKPSGPIPTKPSGPIPTEHPLHVPGTQEGNAGPLSASPVQMGDITLPVAQGTARRISGTITGQSDEVRVRPASLQAWVDQSREDETRRDAVVQLVGTKPVTESTQEKATSLIMREGGDEPSVWMGQPENIDKLNKVFFNSPPLDRQQSDRNLQQAQMNADMAELQALSMQSTNPTAAQQLRNLAATGLHQAQLVANERQKPIEVITKDFKIAPGFHATVGRFADGKDRIFGPIIDVRKPDPALQKVSGSMSQFALTADTLDKERSQRRLEEGPSTVVRQLGDKVNNAFVAMGLDPVIGYANDPRYNAAIAVWNHNILGITALMPNASRGGVQLVKMFHDLAPKPSDSDDIITSKVEAATLTMKALVKDRVENAIDSDKIVPRSLQYLYNKWDLREMNPETLAQGYVNSVKKGSGGKRNPVDPLSDQEIPIVPTTSSRGTTRTPPANQILRYDASGNLLQ